MVKKLDAIKIYEVAESDNPACGGGWASLKSSGVRGGDRSMILEIEKNTV